MRDQFGNIGGPFPQRRQMNGDDVEPVEQIFPEGALFDRRIQLSVGRSHDAHIHLDIVAPPDPADLLFLQHAKELGLQRKTEVSDLIQKQRPLIHGFKQPDLTRLRARKGAFLVPKQLALNQGLRDGGAVQCAKRTVLTGAF